MSFWDSNPTAAETVERLWRDGWSSGRIAAEIGGVSRNAVIGKLHRMGVTSKDGGTPCNKAPKRKSVDPRHVARRKQRFNEFLARAKKAPIEPIPPADDKARVSIFELNASTCRWPVGEPGQPGFGYCGDQVTPGHSYCGGHFLRSRVPLARNKKPLRVSARTGGYA